MLKNHQVSLKQQISLFRIIVLLHKQKTKPIGSYNLLGYIKYFSNKEQSFLLFAFLDETSVVSIPPKVTSAVLQCLMV